MSEREEELAQWLFDWFRENRDGAFVQGPPSWASIDGKFNLEALAKALLSQDSESKYLHKQP